MKEWLAVVTNLIQTDQSGVSTGVRQNQDFAEHPNEKNPWKGL